MVYEILFTDTFLKHFKRLSGAEQKQTQRKLRMLADDPDYPSLRTKSIKGHPGVRESSVNMDIRIIWQFRGELVILALDIGHHDILKKF